MTHVIIEEPYDLSLDPLPPSFGSRLDRHHFLCADERGFAVMTCFEGEM